MTSSTESRMLTPQEKAFILANAYIPEHSVDLIAGISGGEPHLIEDCLVFRKQEELILIGYPLSSPFDRQAFENRVHRLGEKFRSAQVAFIAPEIGDALWESAREKDSDDFFTLDLQAVRVPPPVKRNVRNAGRRLGIEASKTMDAAHAELVEEFKQHASLGKRVEHLLARMPDYVAGSPGGLVLNARDEKNRLAAFYVLDLAPDSFASYVIGCYSRRRYVPGASDLLMDATVAKSREAGKAYIHLGLGVHDGLRRFKRKWGGVPSRPYRMGVIQRKTPGILTGIKAMLHQYY